MNGGVVVWCWCDSGGGQEVFWLVCRHSCNAPNTRTSGGPLHTTTKHAQAQAQAQAQAPPQAPSSKRQQRPHQVGVGAVLGLGRRRAPPHEDLAEAALAELAVEDVLGAAADADLFCLRCCIMYRLPLCYMHVSYVGKGHAWRGKAAAGGGHATACAQHGRMHASKRAMRAPTSNPLPQSSCWRRSPAPAAARGWPHPPSCRAAPCCLLAWLLLAAGCCRLPPLLLQLPLLLEVLKVLSARPPAASALLRTRIPRPAGSAEESLGRNPPGARGSRPRTAPPSASAGRASARCCGGGREATRLGPPQPGLRAAAPLPAFASGEKGLP